jgi:hypothetical protein
MKSLSVCCFTNEPPARIAALLDLLRPVADEIVLAVDAASAAAEAPELAAVADHVYRIRYEPPPERHLAWIHSRCSGDWIFRIDGDEVPSPALVDALPALVAARDVLQYPIPRRWLFPDAEHWLAAEPWAPDYQIRLVRNDPATLRFRGTLHSSAEPVLPARYLEEPIYHLALLTSTQAEREDRVRRYEHLPTNESPVENAAFYLPERRDDLQVAEVPADDRAAIERVLAGSHAARPAPENARPPIDVKASEIDALWELREVPPEAYDARLTPLVDHLELTAAEDREVPLRIENRGSESLPWGTRPPDIHAAYHWLTRDGDVVVADGHRTLLPSTIAPGTRSVVPVRVVAPVSPGEYVLEFDLVHEGVRWFARGARVDAVVRPRRRGAQPVRDATGDRRRFVCVTGMHRSGTSVVSRALNLLGVDLGDERDFLRPAPDNPTGFWEHRAIVELNDEVLAVAGGSAVAPPPLEDGWEQRPEFDPLREQARAVLDATFDRGRVAGWKDPRTSLTLPFWRTVVPIDATILAVRHPLQVVESLRARELLDAESAATMYVRYLAAAYRNDPTCLVVRFDDFFDDVDTVVARIAAFARLPEPRDDRIGEIRAFVDASLRRQKVEGAAGDGTAALAISLYRLVTEQPSEVVLPVLDVLHDSFSSREPPEHEEDGRAAELEAQVAELEPQVAELSRALDELRNRRSVRLALAAARPVGPLIRRIRRR